MDLFINQDKKREKITTTNSSGSLRKKMFEWQEECLDFWFGNNCKGIINVVTGAGKTVFALGAIARLENMLANDTNRILKVKIIVPKVFLANQWNHVLKEDLGVLKDDIGIFSGVRKDPYHRKFMIYVVNSARYTLSQHIAEDYQNKNPILLIADECHHYGSEENAHIFDFVSKIPELSSSSRYFSLGLSATPETINFEERIIPALGPEIFKYGFADALNAKVINNFAIFNIKLNFSHIEYKEYLELSNQITIAIARLRQCCSYLFNQKNTKKFFALLEQLAMSSIEPDLADLAKTFLVISCRRKEVVYRAKSRISCVISLLEQISDTLKVLIFNERIDITNNLYEKLLVLYPNQVGRYHSEMDEDDKRNVLIKYQNSKIRILVACKALDEGLNVPETDVGIIVSSTNSSRQRIQRLGRILRLSKSINVSRLFYLHVGSSNEDQELLADINKEMKGIIPMIDLRYDEEAGSFYNKDYQVLIDKVLRYACRKAWPPLVIEEIERNLELGKLGCDWWQSEESCKMKIRLALTKSERNYWKSIWLIIKARLRQMD